MSAQLIITNELRICNSKHREYNYHGIPSECLNETEQAFIEYLAGNPDIWGVSAERFVYGFLAVTAWWDKYEVSILFVIVPTIPSADVLIAIADLSYAYLAARIESERNEINAFEPEYRIGLVCNKKAVAQGMAEAYTLMADAWQMEMIEVALP